MKVLSLLLAGLLVSGWARAHEPACGTYQVAFYETGLLYYENAAGDHVGIDRDVVEEVARRTGCVLVRVMESRVRTWTALEQGRLDMTVSGIETPARLKFAIFIPYLASNRNYLIVRTTLGARARTLAEFKEARSLRLGVVKGFAHGATLDPWIESLKLEGRVSEVADLEVLARVFAAGRVDAFLSQPIVWPPLLARNQLEGRVQILDVAPRDTAVLGLVLSRNKVSAADAEKMRKAIQAMRGDGTLETIISRYVGKPLGHALAGRPAEN